MSVTVVITRAEAQTANGFLKPIALSHAPGLWWIEEDPLFQIWSNVALVHAHPAFNRHEHLGKTEAMRKALEAVE